MTHQPNEHLLELTQGFIDTIEASRTGQSPLMTGVQANRLEMDGTVILADETNLYFGRIDVTVTDSPQGRYAINSLLGTYNFYEEHGIPLAFRDTFTLQRDTTLYPNVNSQNSDVDQDLFTQQATLGFLLSMNPLDLRDRLGRFQGQTSLTPNGFVLGEHDLVRQCENDDATLSLSFPLLLTEQDVFPTLVAISHILDVNGQDELLSVMWNARTLDHPACAEYACYTNGLMLKDTNGWHTERFQVVTDAPDDY